MEADAAQTVAEFALRWRLSPATVRRYCRDGHLPAGFRAVRFGAGERADWRIVAGPATGTVDELAQRRQSAA